MQISLEFVLKGPIEVIIGLDNDLAPKRRKVNYGSVYWRIYASLIIDVLIHIRKGRAIWRHMATTISDCSRNNLLFDGTKPLSEPMVYHQWGRLY